MFLWNLSSLRMLVKYSRMDRSICTIASHIQLRYFLTQSRMTTPFGRGKYGIAFRFGQTLSTAVTSLVRWRGRDSCRSGGWRCPAVPGLVSSKRDHSWYRCDRWPRAGRTPLPVPQAAGLEKCSVFLGKRAPGGKWGIGMYFWKNYDRRWSWGG